ncbi:sensor domain-containing protein [Oricola indica]|uniref:sensor domain-containing protein n=1 Tax=Oricola indica TaxID=2872591 RepID=UPI001CBE6D3E
MAEGREKSEEIADSDRGKLGAVAERTTSAVVITDARRRIEWVNPAFTAQTGYTLDDVRGRTPRDFLRAPGNDEAVMNALDTAYRNGGGMTCEIRNRSSAGTEYWVEMDVQPVYDRGDLTGFVSIETDITHRKANEQRLREASVFGAMLEDSLNEIYVFDTGTLAFIEANRGARENLGYSIDELRAMTVIDIKPDIDEAAFRDLVADLLSGDEKTIRVESRHKRRDGSLYDVEIHLQMASGAPNRFVAFVLDITARKRAEAEAEAARQRLSAAIETLPDGFALYDADDRLVICNEHYRNIYPLSAPAMVPGATFEEILRHGLAHGEYVQAVGREEEWLSHRLAQHKAAETTVEQHLSNGRWLRIVERLTPDGGRVGLRIDITGQLESRERAERAEQRLVDAIKALPASFWLYDSDDRLVMFNERYRDTFCGDPSFLKPGIAYEEVVRQGVRQAKKASFPGREDDVVARIISHRHEGHSEREYQLADGRWVRSYNQKTSDGGLVGFGIDITEARVRQDELRHAASTDPLTGLANRRGLADYLEAIAKRAGDDCRIAIMHIDLDKFKAVNDAVGHDAGDHVLQYCAGVLLNAARGEGIVARVGGDEFVIVCAAPNDEDIAGMADRLVQRLSAPIPYGEKSCHIGASIGVAFWSPNSEPDVQRRLTDADIALQQSKSRGRGRFHFFEDAMRRRALLSAELAQDICDGLKRDEFEPYLQPQFDLTSGALSGFEALIRWNHPEKGLLVPGEFLFAAEEANLMDALDQRMLERSCALAPELAIAGIENPRISINLSGLRLGDPKIVERIRSTTEAYAIGPHQIVLEILESTLLDERAAHVDNNLRDLVAAGFALELDDFGTGHAAIGNLRKYPLERIKNDRSLVAGIDSDVDLVMITSAITNLAKSLGLKVLAEGVETEAELAVLRQIGCTCVQGYLFARPMPIVSTVAWLQNRDELSSACRLAANS